jgi:hypothetical protein
MSMGGDEASWLLTGTPDDAFVQRRERTIAELQRLHAEALKLSESVGTLSGPGVRRRLREAKQAEADLMRVLDFRSWDDVLAYVAETQAPEFIDLPAEDARPDDDDDAAGVPPRVVELERAELERALANAHAELERLHREMREDTIHEMRALREDLVEMRAQLDHAIAELVLLRLETFAANAASGPRVIRRA